MSPAEQIWSHLVQHNHLKKQKKNIMNIPFTSPFTLKVPETKIAELANSVDLDEVAHNEPPHLDLNCLPSSL